MSITVDKELCIGCGTCAAVCASGFAIAGDGKAEPASQEATDCTQSAAESCPVQAIKIA